MRYLMTFSYDGSCFHGYERQKNLDTVQGLIETVLTSVNNGSSVTIQSSGRTDVLVHALNQKAHFDLDVKVNLYSLKKYPNSLLCFLIPLIILVVSTEVLISISSPSSSTIPNS